MALTKEQIKEFQEAEKEAEDACDLRSVADDIAEAGDKEWAKKVYKKAEGKAKENSYKLLRGLKCMDCDAEIIYDYCENLYICLECGL